MKIRLDHTTEGTAIPFRIVQQVLDVLPFGHVVRVMFRMLLETGMRLTELNRCDMKLLFGNVFYWGLGKNQTEKRPRKVILSDDLVKEIHHYRSKNFTKGSQMFGINENTFRRKFNMEIRPLLPKEWQEQVPVLETDGVKEITEMEYKYQLKGLRKNWATVFFWRMHQKYDDYSLALLLTCKEMRHSDVRITINHYIQEFETLGLNKMESEGSEITIAQICVQEDHQERILAYT